MGWIAVLCLFVFLYNKITAITEAELSGLAHRDSALVRSQTRNYQVSLYYRV